MVTKEVMYQHEQAWEIEHCGYKQKRRVIRNAWEQSLLEHRMCRHIDTYQLVAKEWMAEYAGWGNSEH